MPRALAVTVLVDRCATKKVGDGLVGPEVGCSARAVRSEGGQRQQDLGVVSDDFNRYAMLETVAAGGARARLKAHSQLASNVAQGGVCRTDGARAKHIDCQYCHACLGSVVLERMTR